MIKWSPVQEEAINERDKNLLVSAAAGSGKTAVLVERIIRSIVEEKINIDRMLVVTFTNAAAAGMREKIQKEVVKKIREDKKDRDFLKKQLNFLGKSNISTIHSFCFNVIRKYFYLIDLDPEFKVMDTNDSSMLLEEVIKDILEEKYRLMENKFKIFVDSYSESRGDVKTVNIIKNIYKYILSYPEPLKWLENAVEELSSGEDSTEKSLWIKIIMDEASEYIVFAKNQINEALSICPEDMPYYSAIKSDKYNIEVLTDSLNKGYDSFFIALHETNHERLNSLRGKNKDIYDPELVENIKHLRELYKSAISKIKDFVPSKSIKDMTFEINSMHKPMSALLDIISQVHDEILKRKKNKRMLDFNDAEHLTLAILEYEEACEYYREKFKYIYIDEYQDSNGVQEEIIKRIKSDKNLFMVGDIKQSIYRFRQADPTIFIGKFHEYKKSEKDKLILLNQNFRSRVEILDFVNDIFKNLMKEELGEINYNEDVFLNKGSDFLPRKDSVEFNIIEKKPEEEIEDELQELKTNEIEARFIAERVKKIVGEKTFDPKNNSWIDIGYKDIVILLRSASGWASVFEEVFYDEGIPFYSDITSSYFDTVEIKIMTNLLKLIDNIRQDIPLLSIMRSVIGKFTTDEIIKIRTETLSKEYYKAVFEYKDCFDDDLSYKIKEFLNKIYDWRTRARNTNLSRLIWEILVETDYYYFNGALPNGNIRQGNLKLLTDRAFDFEKEGYSDILDFIDYFERIKKSSGDMTTAKLLGENDNVVRLMTIHKSKGLEFPVVICAGLNKRFNLSDLRDEIILNKICGIAPKYINLEKYIFKETLPRYASKIQIRKENISEEMRILYVALTRAVDRLILVGTIDNFEKWWQKCNDDKANYYNISTKNNYLDWIGMIVSESDKYEVNKISINEFTEFENNVYTKPKDHLQKEFFEKYSIAEYEKIKTKYSFVYPYYEKKLLPDKVTVTDIKELNLRNEKSVRYKIPNLKEIPAYKGKKLGFTPAEIGTITHSVLQLIGLKIDMTKEYIKESVSLMVEKKQLTKEEAEVVEVDKIYAFYNSKLGRRMLVSTKIKREQPFIVKKRIEKLIEREKSKLFQEVLVQGIIDCYFYENGKIILIDYKTDRAFSNNRDSIIKHYAPQVLEYKEALEILTKTKVHETYLYLLNNSEEIKIE